MLYLIRMVRQRMPERTDRITVIGAGLAGCEAAHIIASFGIDVDLYEMKPARKSPAHKSDLFAELVCSNSLRAAAITNAVGLLKEELRRLGSLIMEAADKAEVPAGGALAVDRDEFSSYITESIKNDPHIHVLTEEVTSIPRDRMVIVATGPLTDGDLYDDIMRLTGNLDLHFFDAAAPIVSADSIDMNKAFRQSRYGKGGNDYINCPMNEEEYKAFYNAIISACCSASKPKMECITPSAAMMAPPGTPGAATIITPSMSMNPVNMPTSKGISVMSINATEHATILRQLPERWMVAHNGTTKPAMPPSFCASAITCRASVVLPPDSGP